MPSFRSSRDQARHAVKQVSDIGSSRHTNRDDGRVRSIRTAKNYEQCLSGLTTWLQANRLGDLSSLDRDTALRYLDERSELVRQSTLDQDRQAIQALLGGQLPRIKSELETALSGRAYIHLRCGLIVKRFAAYPVSQHSSSCWQLYNCLGIRQKPTLPT